ncbi:MAG: ABC transporter substrate-binding protein [Bacillota bacterium]|jgi:ABC-type glycerol-3-phosphate transport system substrate-binding protein|nr:extracellular solute-binding protein [Bacillota bacterium]NLU54846.1 extracellular solute-binding protein [Bacillota bacterium]HOA90682.1 extracellular solute-binding protein [Bacillota bacterium]HOJ45799.1 extracellular solute-binding protein [Bacillota bacterium]HOP53000.1 extracellular solute-binding protein [Bacillota bacterium]
MKKRFAILLVILAVALGVNAVTLEVWWTRPNEIAQVIKDMANEYFTPQTGIELNFTAMNYDDLWSKAMLALAAGDTPDLASFGSEWPVEFGMRGGLVDLRAEHPEEFAEIEKKLYPGQMRSLEFMGTAFGIPVEFGFGLTYYRTDIFAENGWEYPTTWDEVRALLPKFQANGMNLACISQYLLPDFQSVMTFIWQHGGVYVNDDGVSSGLNTPEAIAGFKELMELFTVYKIPQAPVPMNTFASGEYPLVVGGNWNYSAVDQGFPQIRGKWSVGLTPGTVRSDGFLSHSIYNGPLPIGIFKNSKYQKEGWEFIKWFMQDEVQAEYGRRVMQVMPSGFFFSANMNVASKIDYFPEDHVKVMYEQSYHSMAPRYGLGSVVSQRHVTNAAMSVILQGTDPEKALLEAHDLVQAEMKRKQVEFARFISRLK